MINKIVSIIRAFAVAMAILLCLPAVLTAAQQPGVAITEGEVRIAVENLLQQKTVGRGWDARLRKVTIPAGVKVPNGPRELELVAPPNWEGWGNATLTLLVRVNGRVERNISVRVEADVIVDMVVAARQIMSGTVLSSQDLAIQKHDIAASQGRYIATIDEAVGKKLRVSARQNAPVRSDQLEKVPIVKSGQLLTIIAEGPSIRITGTGRSRGAGSAGDIIMVQNLGSAREIPARIIDSNTVLVAF